MKLRHLLLLTLALLAARMASRALKDNAQVMSLLWVLVSMTATLNTANTAKTRAVEGRVAAVVAAVGSATGMASSAQATANNALPKTGGTVTGNVAVTGSHTVGGQINGTTLSLSGGMTDFGHTSHGTISADGNMNAGGAANITGNITSGGTLSGVVLFVNGQRIAPGQGRPVFYPVAGGSSPSNASIGAALNQIVGCLIAAGISV
jgi:hypothetical protein